MHLIFRPARLTDFPAGLLCVRDAFAFDETGRRDLLQMWCALRQSGASNIFAFEDIQEPDGLGLAFLAVYAFATEEFAAALRATTPPCIALQALEWWQAGRAPFLDLPALRRANTNGEVSLVCLHSGVPNNIMEKPEGREVVDRGVDWIYLALGGYRLKEYFLESYSEWQYGWSTSAGLDICRDYVEYYGSLAGPQQARLYAITRDSALARQGSLVAPLFRYEPPRFFFTPGEQELLHWALLDLTNEELAEELGIAVISVRKRWNRIYDRVLDIAPELFPTKTLSAASQKRGGEKKRYLLQYLRFHVEELRPVCRPR